MNMQFLSFRTITRVWTALRLNKLFFGFLDTFGMICVGLVIGIFLTVEMAKVNSAISAIIEAEGVAGKEKALDETIIVLCRTVPGETFRCKPIGEQFNAQ